MTCSRCSSALVTPDQVDRGLCAMCLTGASLSALVGLAASHQTGSALSTTLDPVVVENWREFNTFQPPIYFGHRLTNFDSGTYHRSDAEWKRDTFPQETQ